MFLINAPAAVVAVGLFFFLDDITRFEITYLLEVNVVIASRAIHFHLHLVCGSAFLIMAILYTYQRHCERLFDIEGCSLLYLLCTSVERNSFNGIVYFQVIRMLNNVTRMAVGMSDLGSQLDTYADMKTFHWAPVHANMRTGGVTTAAVT
nr:G-protein coupled receptor 1 [Tanacetum cinerariifolium]